MKAPSRRVGVVFARPLTGRIAKTMPKGSTEQMIKHEKNSSVLRNNGLPKIAGAIFFRLMWGALRGGVTPRREGSVKAVGFGA
jgi:hypothetical protein